MSHKARDLVWVSDKLVWVKTRLICPMLTEFCVDWGLEGH